MSKPTNKRIHHEETYLNSHHMLSYEIWWDAVAEMCMYAIDCDGASIHILSRPVYANFADASCAAREHIDDLRDQFPDSDYSGNDDADPSSADGLTEQTIEPTPRLMHEIMRVVYRAFATTHDIKITDDINKLPEHLINAALLAELDPDPDYLDKMSRGKVRAVDVYRRVIDKLLGAM